MVRILILFLCFVSMTGAAQDPVSENVKVLAHWDGEDIPFNISAKYNDVWGFTVDGMEYGCIGSTLGTHIMQIPEIHKFTEVAYVPGKFQGPVVHRDFAFFENHLYAVCDQGSSSLQIIDVSLLPESYSVVLDDSTHFKTAHNVTVDEYGEKLYISGPTGGALKIFDLSDDPANPEFIGNLQDTYPDIEYVHDVYARRDSVFLNCGSQGLFVFDFSDGSNPQIIGALDGYPNEGYNHSGWMSDCGEMYAFADETPGKKMKIIDITDMTDLDVLSLFNSGTEDHTTPHNLEWIGDKIYVSHYFDGLQIFDVSDPENPLKCGYYDTYTKDDIGFRGAWGVHVLPSGRILISDRQTGLYLFKLEEPDDDNSDIWVYPNPSNGEFEVNLSEYTYEKVRFKLTDTRGKAVFEIEVLNPSNDTRHVSFNTSHLNSGVYFLETLIDEGEWKLNRIVIE